MKHKIIYKVKQAAKVALVSFPLLVNSAHAGFLDNVKKDIDRRVDEGKKAADTYKEKAREDYNRKKEETQRKYEDTKRKADEEYQRRREEFQRNVEDNKRKADEYYKDKSRELRETYETKKEETETFVREGGIERTIDNIERAKNETTITVIKNIPVYDPADGQLKSYDNFIRENFSEGLRGTSLEDDPVKGAYYLYNDPNHLMNAKIISTDNGFISINEAIKTGLRREEAQQTRNYYYNMREAYNNNDIDNLNRYSNLFNDSITNINSGATIVPYRKPLKETDFEDIGRRIKDSKAYDIYKNLDSKLINFYTEKLDLSRDTSEIASKLTIFVGMPILFFWTLGRLKRRKPKDEIDEEDDYDKELIKPKIHRIKEQKVKSPITKVYKIEDKIEELEDDTGAVNIEDKSYGLEQHLTSKIHRATTMLCAISLFTIGGATFYLKNNNIKNNPVRIESNVRNLESLIKNINSRIVKEPKYKINLLENSETYHDLDNDGINEEISSYHGYIGPSESSTTYFQINNHSQAVVIAGMNMKNNNHTIILQECFIDRYYCDSSYTRRLKYIWDGERLEHGGNGYKLQICSKETPSEATEEARKIRNQGFNHTYVYSKEVKGKTWYAVYIGPFKSKNDALLAQTVYYEINPYTEKSIVRKF